MENEQRILDCEIIFTKLNISRFVNCPGQLSSLENRIKLIDLLEKLLFCIDKKEKLSKGLFNKLLNQINQMFVLEEQEYIYNLKYISFDNKTIINHSFYDFEKPIYYFEDKKMKTENINNMSDLREFNFSDKKFSTFSKKLDLYKSIINIIKDGKDNFNFFFKHREIKELCDSIEHISIENVNKKSFLKLIEYFFWENYVYQYDDFYEYYNLNNIEDVKRMIHLIQSINIEEMKMIKIRDSVISMFKSYKF